MTGANGGAQSGNGTLMAFPCEVDIKVFVRADKKLEQQVHALLLSHLDAEQVLSIRLRESRRGKYHALSCRVRAMSRMELDDVYRSLTKHPDIVMVI
jgi:putative lipoic acid-binding regulatory protein